MHLIEIFPIVATICLILGDVTQLEKVVLALHCRSVSLLKWVLSAIANTLMPGYYYLQQQYVSAIVALVLWVVCVAICIIIMYKRHQFILRLMNHEDRNSY